MGRPWSGRADAPAIHSIAILPLADLSGNSSEEYFADGMTDELTTVLAKLPSLRVISRTSVQQYKGARTPASEIGRALSVDALVEGSVLRAEDRVRITVQLIYNRTEPLSAARVGAHTRVDRV